MGSEEVSFFNGIATGVMTFDAAPAEVTLRGGETDDLMAQDYDGTLYNVAGLAEFKKLPRAQQIFLGGYYTVYVTPSLVDGVYRLVTTIRVQLGS
jgi:hypothetical protein